MNNPYIELAKQSVRHYLENDEVLAVPEDLPKEIISRKSGVFVTLMKEGNLRGCIGTFLPTKKNIAEEIIHNAVAAAFEDPRFSPVSKEELDGLCYEVSLLETPRPINSLSELDPKKFGILVKATDGRSGLLLPDLEGIDSPIKQIHIASRKGGINPNVDQVVIYRFEVEKHK